MSHPDQNESYDLTRSVGHQLAHVMSLMRREVESRMAVANCGLTQAQWKPLWMIKTGRACTSVEVAREAWVDAGAMTRLIDRLEAKGLVERTRSETDRRVVNLRLTPAGEDALAQVAPVLVTVNEDILRGFSPQERQQLQNMLERLLANGQALGQAPNCTSTTNNNVTDDTSDNAVQTA